jgi:tRNA-uridine 2-sulfurtransferase
MGGVFCYEGRRRRSMKSPHKAIALFSGGLDSLLCVLWMQNLGYEIIPIFFRTPFFTEERALQTAVGNNLSLVVEDISDKHLDMLQHPVYGFGKNFNPCIDCHGLMFHLAGILMDKYEADFLISGEVLSQRPMSQRKDAMNAVGKLSGFKDLLIRPLSQQLLADTLPIREGWINKNDLLAFSGRSRKPQLALAKELGVTEFPSPAGGCRLTDKNFTVRLRDLVDHAHINMHDINLLKYGRHFRLDEKTKLIIGRDETDNQNLVDAGQGYLLLLNEDIPGPLGLLCSPDNLTELIEHAASLLAFYNKKSPARIRISYGFDLSLGASITVDKASEEDVMRLMIKG